MGLFSGGTEIINNGELLEGGIPTATIVPWSDSSVPSGFLECNGSAVSRSTYADLFAIIGTTYGSGNGSTTFNVPDLQDNVAVGKSGTKNLASTGGANTVSVSGNVGTNVTGNVATNTTVTSNASGGTANASLSIPQLAAHDHIQSSGGTPPPGQQVFSPGSLIPARSGDAFVVGSGAGHSHNLSVNISSNASSSSNLSANASSNFSGDANSVVQPYLTVIYIIKT